MMDLSSSFSRNYAIRGGRLLDTANNRDQVTDIYIANGEIIAIGKQPDGFAPEQEINANGMLILPGVIDICARLREPGFEHKGTIHSETRAAAKGGVTHICCPPDTDPVIDTPAVASLIQERASQSGYAQVIPIGALTKNLEGLQLSEMNALKEAGCIAMTQLRHPFKNTKIQQRCLEYAATFDLPVFFQSEDHGLKGSGLVHYGSNSSRLGLPGIPETAETIGISRDLLLVEQTGIRAHFGQISCARSVELIEQAQTRGLPVTADVAAHQLFFTDEVLDGFNSQYHVDPPFRSENDRRALLGGLKRGVISVICSDHQPHEAEAKAAPFADTAAGISSIEVLLPLTYRLVKKGFLTEAEWISALTSAPASVLGIDAGQIQVNTPANLTLFDPNQSWVMNSDSLISHGSNTPFIGESFTGRVRMTFCDGHVTFQDLMNHQL